MLPAWQQCPMTTRVRRLSAIDDIVGNSYICSAHALPCAAAAALAALSRRARALAASRPELCGALWQTREGRSRVEWVEEGGEKVCMRRPACAGRSASAWAARARPD